MKLQPLPVTVFAISVLLASSLPAHARPVTTADLSGKMICWSSGVVQSFEADGKSAASGKYADGVWSVSANGVRLDFPGGGANVDMEIQPDGTFTSEFTDSGGTHKGAGNICKTKPPIPYADALVGKKLCWDGGDVETFFACVASACPFINSVDGEGIGYINSDGFSSGAWKFKKFDEVFKGTGVQLEDGRVVYTGSEPGVDYGLSTAVFCK